MKKRGKFIKTHVILIVLGLVLCAPTGVNSDTPSLVSADDARKLLMEGNNRFVRGELTAAAVDDAKEPDPIATIVKAIRPAVEQTKGQPGDPLENGIRADSLDIAARWTG